MTPSKPPPGSVEPTRRRLGYGLAWGLAGLLAFVAFGACTVVFLAGETLFGSSRGTIDAYNRDALDDVDLPAGAILVQERLYEETLPDGVTVRFLSRLYITSYTYAELRAHFNAHRPSGLRGVSVAFHPPAFRWEDEPGLTPIKPVAPSPSESVFVVSAGQRVVKGRF